MDTKAIAMQQYATQNIGQQNANGVVKNVNGESNLVNASTPENGQFAELIQTLLQQGIKSAGLQLVAKEGEENAQMLAAQMLAQNPLLAALMAQGGLNLEGAEQMLATMGGITCGQAIEQGNIATAQQNFAMLEAQAAATVQAQANPAQEATAQAASSYAVSVQGQAQPSAQAAAQSVLQHALQDAKVTVEKDTGSQAKEQAKMLFEQSSVESAAQRARIIPPQQNQTKSDANPNEQRPSGETPLDPKIIGTMKAEQTQATQGKSENDDQANASAAIQGFDKQLENVKEAQLHPQTQSVKSEGEAEIIRQTSEGIKQNLSLGKEEFVMRLKPEGLGEITVKLENINGRMTLQLTAQNQNVQRVIEGEIDALKQAVKPYNIEVRELGGGNNAGLNMSFSSQNQNEQQQQLYSHMNGRFAFGEGSNKHHSTYESFLNGDSQDVSDDISVQSYISSNTALDTYI